MASLVVSSRQATLGSVHPSALPDAISAAVPDAVETVTPQPEIGLTALAGRTYSIQQLFPAAPAVMKISLSDVRYVAGGGCGFVYKATQAEPQRIVAIKHYLEEGNLSARHEDEILCFVQGNRSVVSRFGFYAAGLESWLLIEALDQTLSDWRHSLGTARVDMNRVQSITTDIFSGLQFLQSKRVLHLDIKPDNVGLDPQGRAKIFDFGISVILPPGADFMESGQGTPGLRAPEHASNSRVSVKTDIFAAGIVVYFMISGELIPLEINRGTSKKQMKMIFEEWGGNLLGILGDLSKDSVIGLVASFLFHDVLVYEAKDRKGFPAIWKSGWLAGSPTGDASHNLDLGEKRKAGSGPRQKSSKKCRK